MFLWRSGLPLTCEKIETLVYELLCFSCINYLVKVPKPSSNVCISKLFFVLQNGKHEFNKSIKAHFVFDDRGVSYEAADICLRIGHNLDCRWFLFKQFFCQPK